MITPNQSRQQEYKKILLLRYFIERITFYYRYTFLGHFGTCIPDHLELWNAFSSIPSWYSSTPEPSIPSTNHKRTYVGSCIPLFLRWGPGKKKHFDSENIISLELTRTNFSAMTSSGDSGVFFSWSQDTNCGAKSVKLNPKQVTSLHKAYGSSGWQLQFTILFTKFCENSDFWNWSVLSRNSQLSVHLRRARLVRS